MTTTRKKPRYTTFTNKLDPCYWPGWDPQLITSGDVGAIGEEMAKRAESAGADLTGAWMIKHDRDRKDDGTLKDVHVHGVFATQKDGRSNVGKLALNDWNSSMGFTKAVFQAPPRGGRIENAQSYLIHAKDRTKFQYAPSDVVTLRGESYEIIERKNRKNWGYRSVIGRSEALSSKEWTALGDSLVQMILDGEINRRMIFQDDKYVDIYARNATAIETAFRTAMIRDCMVEVDRLRNGEFSKFIFLG